MDKEETKSCPNCKREIPAVNFTIHSVHCARNIKICPVCKEPVPHAELAEHHDKLHKLLPCKKCGESVCGTDLEDHIRDSCAHTIKSCRFCDLELPRRELPAHEGYCGVRTEQCADCREWVMIKYRQLHLDSNHGFIRLHDDPAPQPKTDIPRIPRIPIPSNVLTSTSSSALPNGPSTSNGVRAPKLDPNSYLKNTNVTQDRPRTEVRHLGSATAGGSRGEGQKLPSKRTNDQPQININAAATDKVNKQLSMSRGAVKKRPAPPPPAPTPPPADPRRDLPYYEALRRQQAEEAARREQTAYNLAHGLPPVLSPAEKLERLRKMDALHNRETEPADYRHRLQGRVWQGPDPGDPGRVLGSTGSEQGGELLGDYEPMTPEEFMRRFNDLQLQGEGAGVGAGPGAVGAEAGGDGPPRDPPARKDRISEIKSSLQVLRRGLNEVTAPYNSNVNGSASGPRVVDSVPRRPPSEASSSDSDEEVVRLPCEFCGVLQPADDLVQHQTGCRPDLAQYRPPSAPPAPPPRPPQQPPPPAEVDDPPVIPCEFCTESLPVYLISEHQERCRRVAIIPGLLYPD